MSTPPVYENLTERDAKEKAWKDMTTLERFRYEEAKLHGAFGLVQREVREAQGPLAECDATRAALAHRRGCLLLLGDPGTGKSVAAARWLLLPSAHIAHWFTTDGYPGVKWDYRGTKGLWRSARSLARVQQYDEAAIEALTKPDRLVLDDFGVEFLDTKGFLRSLIDEIVQERHRRELLTVITANLSVPEFVERYGRRVSDRIAETGQPVVCLGRSFRTAKPVSLSLPAISTDADVEARHQELAVKREARQAADRAKWEAEHAQWEAERVKRGQRTIVPFAQRAAAKLAEEKAIETETPEQIAERENETRREMERKLAAWRVEQGQAAAGEPSAPAKVSG